MLSLSPGVVQLQVCIDQENIADGLRLLPVNVMACRRMLVLFGPTYPSRLWCVWELFTLCSFLPATDASKHVQLHLFGEGSNYSALQSFDYMDAFCYDPNEQGKLRSIVGTVGGAVFNGRIRELAAQVLHK